MCQTRVLSTRDQITISHCMHCKLMYIWHNNLLLNFTTEKFLAFRNALSKLKYEDCGFPFPDQEDRAIISCPHPEISFAFSWEEWQDLIEVMDEASYMKEVYSLME